MSTVKAVILVGGEGTRLRPLTSNTPKPMVPILNKPFLEHVIKHLSKHGINDIILALCYLPGLIESHFKDGSEFGVRLIYAVEDFPLGTAGAVKNVAGHLEKTCVVLNGDIFTDLDFTAMIAFHRERKAKVSIALTPVENPTIYGVVETDEQSRVRRFIEKPNWDAVTTNMINAGAYVLEPEMLNHIPPATYSMFEHELFPLLLSLGEPVYGFPSDSYWIDIGTPEKYLLLNRDLLMGKVTGISLGNNRGTEAQVAESCTIHRTVKMAGPVVIGEDCTIGQGVKINGPSVIGPGCMIEENTLIEGAILWSNVYIGKQVNINNCVAGNNCRIEDNVCLADKVVLGNDVVVGSGSRLEHGIKLWPGEIIEPGTNRF